MAGTDHAKLPLRACTHWDRRQNRRAPVVGITGGHGSGKSACTSYLSRYDIPVVDADIVNACILDIHEQCLDEIAKAFGKGVIDDFGRVHRPSLAKIVFGNPEKRGQLEAIVHPRIREEIHSQIKQWRDMGAPYILLVIPLLPESGRDRWPLDWVALILADRQKRIDRLMARSKGRTADGITSVMAAQSSAEDYQSVADEIIENNGSLAQLHTWLDDFHHRMLVKFGAFD